MKHRVRSVAGLVGVLVTTLELAGCTTPRVAPSGVIVQPLTDDREHRPADAVAEADQLDRRVVALYRSGRYAEAIVRAEKAVALREDLDLVCLLTTTLRDAPMYRLTVQPTGTNGLHAESHILIDKVFALRADRCGPVFGHLEQDMMLALNRMLALVMGMAD
jgi:mRNA interferase MazF